MTFMAFTDLSPRGPIKRYGMNRGMPKNLPAFSKNQRIRAQLAPKVFRSCNANYLKIESTGKIRKNEQRKKRRINKERVKKERTRKERIKRIPKKAMV